MDHLIFTAKLPLSSRCAAVIALASGRTRVSVELGPSCSDGCEVELWDEDGAYDPRTARFPENALHHLRTTESTHGGAVEFEGVEPGSYLLRAVRLEDQHR